MLQQLHVAELEKVPYRRTLSLPGVTLSSTSWRLCIVMSVACDNDMSMPGMYAHLPDPTSMRVGGGGGAGYRTRSDSHQEDESHKAPSEVFLSGDSVV